MVYAHMRQQNRRKRGKRLKNTENNQIIRIAKHPEYAAEAAHWFHAKWNVPLAAYEESMAECIRQKNKVPQWYLVCGDAGAIIAGTDVCGGNGNRKQVIRGAGTDLICAAKTMRA